MASSVGSRPRRPEDELVHWCHGAPGWIPLFCHSEISNHEFAVDGRKMLGRDIAERFGECVWQKGLLRKGLGLCHGIGGNGLVLLTLFNATKNKKEWVQRNCRRDSDFFILSLSSSTFVQED